MNTLQLLLTGAYLALIWHTMRSPGMGMTWVQRLIGIVFIPLLLSILVMWDDEHYLTQLTAGCITATIAAIVPRKPEGSHQRG